MRQTLRAGVGGGGARHHSFQRSCGIGTWCPPGSRRYTRTHGLRPPHQHILPATLPLAQGKLRHEDASDRRGYGTSPGRSHSQTTGPGPAPRGSPSIQRPPRNRCRDLGRLPARSPLCQPNAPKFRGQSSPPLPRHRRRQRLGRRLGAGLPPPATRRPGSWGAPANLTPPRHSGGCRAPLAMASCELPHRRARGPTAATAGARSDAGCATGGRERGASHLPGLEPAAAEHAQCDRRAARRRGARAGVTTGFSWQPRAGRGGRPGRASRSARIVRRGGAGPVRGVSVRHAAGAASSPGIPGGVGGALGADVLPGRRGCRGSVGRVLAGLLPQLF
ncbi:translation initiation factor IF-2-like [Elephas maximus indicus]|uniref:translation initiation factor IF-2-like n=1 Tax=Elephas maximus indicus TaxID=99487 RepID=UPI0021166B5D|nr:translation initiation factor IF-2-like [Elephas maximus indicus]